MNTTMLSDYLTVIRPFLNHDLISEHSFNTIFNFSTNFYPFFKSGFECRLSEGNSRVDFLVGIPPGDNPIPKNINNQLFWNEFDYFYKNWQESNSPIFKCIDAVGLEFDFIDYEENRFISPCVFMAVKANSHLYPSFFRDCFEIWPLNRVFNDGSLRSLEAIDKCISFLPAGAWIAHIGAMLSRPTNMMRIVIKDIGPTQIPEYLESISCSANFECLTKFIANISHLVDSISLAIDVGESISPTIGLECRISANSPYNKNWENFVHHLIDIDLCTAVKGKALLDWPSVIQKKDCLESWPKDLEFGDLLCGNDAFSVIYKDIYHIKINYCNNQAHSAKAYLEFGHRWLSKKNLKKISSHSSLANQYINQNELNKDEYLQKVTDYYDFWNPIILKTIGTTYQAGLLKTSKKCTLDVQINKNNLFIAERAKIQPDQKILDAGCGVCGPSICIAKNYSNVNIDAITISSEQKKSATRFIKENKLDEKIQITVGDFHQLPYDDSTYDLVLFLESLGYSYDIKQVLLEVWRVLKPSGRIFIKDVFVKEHTLSLDEEKELQEFNKIYVYRTLRMTELIKVAVEVGFNSCNPQNLSYLMTSERVNEVMFEELHGMSTLTKFGQYHYHPSKCLPVYFAELTAKKM